MLNILDNTPEKILKIFKKYDYLMFFDFFTDSAVLTLKLFEYIGANKPIICIGGNKNSESKNFKSNI